MADATVYGKLHMSIDAQDNGSTSGLTHSSNDSRLGFKGSEDLGNGMSTIFQVEVDLDGGSANNLEWNNSLRNTYIGVAGNWGAVITGKHDTPYKITGRKVELFGDTRGDFRQLSGRLGHEARPQNVIAYKMPTLGGFNLLAAYVIEDNVNDQKTEAFSANADWSNDMFWVGAGMTQTGEDLQLNGDVGPTKQSNWRVAGQFKMAGFKVNAMYDSQETDANNIEHTGYVLGLAWGTGAHTIKGQYSAYNVKADGGVDVDDTAYAIGYDYALSKKSTLYAIYNAQDNDDGVDGKLWKGVEGNDPSNFGVGMVLKF
jgi:predicted porin